MEQHEKKQYVKRTEKEYSMSFTLQLFQEIEKAQFTVPEAAKKYRIQNRTTIVKWPKKLGRLIRKIKYYLLYQSHQNT